jgi:probable phosphoglycerate mutase
VSAARVLVVRHGRTAWNKERFLGRADVPLDRVGRAQAAALAVLLAADPVDRVLCSPLRRALDTAGPLARRHALVPRVYAALSELDCGEWEGRPKTGAERKISKRDPHLPLPGGESVADVAARVDRLLRGRAEDLRDGVTVLVGHYLTSQLVVAALTGVPLGAALRSAYRPAPGSAYELVARDGGWHPVGFRAPTVAVAS